MLHRLEEFTGIDIKTILLDDKETMHLIRNADTLGISEFDSDFVRNMILEINLLQMMVLNSLYHFMLILLKIIIQ